MSQIQVRANLLATDFALTTKFQGRTILMSKYDQPSTPAQSNSLAGKDNDAQPECYYMHNVLPTINGYKSVAYANVINPPPVDETFIRLIAFRDSDFAPEQDRGYIGITASGRTYMISTLNAYWVNVTPAGQTVSFFGISATEVTVATVLGISYICYSNFGIFNINMHTPAMLPVTLLGITASSIKGISSSNNYMLLHDGATVYWSSALNPLDFVPSLITGAGSGTPASTGGPIRLLSPLATGFAVYTSTNIVIALFSGNTRYPWVFKEAYNSSGIDQITAVSSSGDDGSNYAWTSAGLLKITQLGATPVLPEITDFLSGNIIENYDPATKTFSTTATDAKLTVQISYSSARYVIISYGIGPVEMQYALIYDLALKRVGKLKIPHVAAFEFVMDYTGNNITYKQSTTEYRLSTFTTSAGIQIQDAKTLSATPAAAKHTMAFLTPNGNVKLSVEDYTNYNSDAVLFLGKYQLVRNNLITVQGVTVETVDKANTNFTISDIVSYDGVRYQPAQALYVDDVEDVRTYLCRITGVNHSFLIEGAFNLVSFLISFSMHGRA